MVCRSISATISGGAEPPKSGLYLMPLNSAELWLAVTTTPPAACCCVMAHDTAGVGVTRSRSTTFNPLATRTRDTSLAKISAQYRES